jgi:hypothetical protein
MHSAVQLEVVSASATASTNSPPTKVDCIVPMSEMV